MRTHLNAQQGANFIPLSVYRLYRLYSSLSIHFTTCYSVHYESLVTGSSSCVLEKDFFFKNKHKYLHRTFQFISKKRRNAKSQEKRNPKPMEMTVRKAAAKHHRIQVK